MLQSESTLTLLKMAAVLALLVFGLRLSTPVPHEVGPLPVTGPACERADDRDTRVLVFLPFCLAKKGINI